MPKIASCSALLMRGMNWSTVARNVASNAIGQAA